MKKRGTVEDVIDHEGAWQQLVTIDGVLYAVHPTRRHRDWQVGDTVTFNAYERRLFHGPYAMRWARRIHKVVTP